MKCFTTCSALIFCVLILSCSDQPGSDSYRCVPCEDNASQAGNAFTALTITGTKWLYILQDGVPSDIGASGFDTVVMDYSADGSDTEKYSTADLDLMKAGPPAKQVIAYLSIGEAEDYRYYFNKSWLSGTQPGPEAPCWLNRTNEDWEGNYKVQYWSETWQQIVLGYLDKIIDQGFDGVYLDIIDGFEYWSDSDNREGYTITSKEAAVRMINFVKRIAFHARVTREKIDFLIIPQNGENILQHDTGLSYLAVDDYIKTISAMGIEDLYYYETTPVSSEERDYRLTFINQIENASKKVIVVDYLYTGNSSQSVTDWLYTVTNASFYPYAALSDRELNIINTFSGQP